MTAFALSDEVHELLRDPENPMLLERAQEYTEDFAAVKGIFEGLEVKMLILTASFCFRPLFRIPSLHTLYQTAKKYQESVLAFPMRAQTSMPSRPGILMSSSMRFGCCSARATASRPFAAVSTS